MEQRLLNLMVCLDITCIPISMLHDGHVSRWEWDESGEPVEIDYLADGIDESLGRLLADKFSLDGALDVLLDAGIISKHTSKPNTVTISTERLEATIQKLGVEKISYWRGQALRLVSRLFCFDSGLPGR